MTTPALTRTNLAGPSIAGRKKAIVDLAADRTIDGVAIRKSRDPRFGVRLEVHVRPLDPSSWLLLADLQRFASDLGCPWNGPGYIRAYVRQDPELGSWRRQCVEGGTADGGARIVLVDITSRA